MLGFAELPECKMLPKYKCSK